jgi:GNAT superfamily N-acetyltransferase
MIEDHYLIVATHDGEIVGFLGMMLGPVLFNPDYTQAVEIFFYVQPEYRKRGIAENLHEEADFYLEDKVDVVGFGDMSSATDMDQFYTDRGFALTERTYTKVL